MLLTATAIQRSKHAAVSAVLQSSKNKFDILLDSSAMWCGVARHGVDTQPRARQAESDKVAIVYDMGRHLHAMD